MSEHWDDTVCYTNYLLIAMFVQLCVTRWNDTLHRLLNCFSYQYLRNLLNRKKQKKPQPLSILITWR
ncbi:MAG: hypothetical protein ACR5K3_00100 [Wolbachia sp.]